MKALIDKQSPMTGGPLCHLDEPRLAALRAAIDEGNASPDVVGFDRDAFLEELRRES